MQIRGRTPPRRATRKRSGGVFKAAAKIYRVSRSTDKLLPEGIVPDSGPHAMTETFSPFAPTADKSRRRSAPARSTSRRGGTFVLLGDGLMGYALGRAILQSTFYYRVHISEDSTRTSPPPFKPRRLPIVGETFLRVAR